MAITTLTIIVEDTVNNTGTICINNEPVYDCDLSFLGTYPCDLCDQNVAVAAVQWDAGTSVQEIELVTNGSNIASDSLDATIAASAQSAFDARKAAIEAEEAAAAAAAAAEDDAYFDTLLSELTSGTLEGSEEGRTWAESDY